MKYIFINSHQVSITTHNNINNVFIINKLIINYYYNEYIIIILGQWISPTVTGDRPPPISHFTLTSINNSSAILFGGATANGDSNNVYILNFTDTSVVSVLLV